MYAVEFDDKFTVESLGVIENDVYDIEVENNHNFIANNICVHNSQYINLSWLVYSVFGKDHATDPETINKITDFLSKVCQKIEDDVLKPGFEEMAKNMNAFKNQIAMKREGISSRGIFIAKKRYLLNVIDNEGVRYAKPKLKMMGIEAVKSSTPAPCRDAMKELFDILISGSEQQAQAFISGFRNKFDALQVEDKAFPRGVSDVKTHMDPRTIYKKGTPINSRAAILYNHMVKTLGLQDKYELIGDGDKIKYVYLNPKNPTREDIIGFVTVLPPEFGLHSYIDNDTQFQKAFVDPVKGVLDAIGWNVEETSTLEDFFS